MEVKLDPDRLGRTKAGRNSGRTVDALARAVSAAKERGGAAFVTACDAEVEGLRREVEMVCEHYQIRCEPYSFDRRMFKIDGSPLVVLNANSDWGRGNRAHFVLDHSCRELLTPQQFANMLDAIAPAHEGEWPPFGV